MGYKKGRGTQIAKYFLPFYFLSLRL